MVRYGLTAAIFLVAVLTFSSAEELSTPSKTVDELANAGETTPTLPAEEGLGGAETNETEEAVTSNNETNEAMLNQTTAIHDAADNSTDAPEIETSDDQTSEVSASPEMRSDNATESEPASTGNATDVANDSLTNETISLNETSSDSSHNTTEEIDPRNNLNSTEEFNQESSLNSTEETNPSPNGEEEPRKEDDASSSMAAACKALPSGPGPCFARIVAYTWIGNQCTKFLYGGCGATKNFFYNKKECLHVCSSPGDRSVWHVETNPDMEKGDKNASEKEHVPEVNTNEGLNDSFDYGTEILEAEYDDPTARKPNRNRCHAKSLPMRFIPETCTTVPDEQRKIQAFYTFEGNMCLSVRYEMCIDHSIDDSVLRKMLTIGNLFRSHRECENNCKTKRLNAKSLGSCYASGGKSGECRQGQSPKWDIKWSYDTKEGGLGKCNYFWHSGCGGGENVFDTQHDCWRQCVQNGDKYAKKHDLWNAKVEKAAKKKYGNKWREEIYVENYDFSKLGVPVPNFLHKLEPVG